MTAAYAVRRSHSGLPPGAGATAYYVTMWAVLAVASSLGIVRFFEQDVAVSRSEVAVLVAVTALAEGVQLYLHHGRSTEFISLVEVAIAINLFLLAPADALGVTLAGVAIANLAHRRHAFKFVFNVAQYAVATAAAIAVFHALGGSHIDMTLRTAGALVVATGSFGIVNALAMSGLVSLLEGRSFVTAALDGWRISSLTVFGNTAVGILAAVVWRIEPELTPLFIAPALTLHLAYRGVIRTSELLEQATAERDRLNRIVVGASNGIVLLDAQGRVDLWNPAMESLTGVEPDEATGAPLAAVFTGIDEDEEPVDVAFYTPPGESIHVSTFEMNVTHRRGRSKIVKVRRNALLGSDGEALGHVLMVDDVTRERETERLKDDFLARVSHELRTPLTPIKGYAHALRHKRDRMTPDSQDQALDLIVGRVGHMEGVIDDLLLVGQLGAGHSALGEGLSSDMIDITLVAEMTLEHFRKSEAGRQFELDAPAGVKAVADAKRVGQILINLLSNACKYSAPDAPVKMKISPGEEYVLVGVTDFGRGIPADQLGQIFERFHRVEDPLVMETGGMGLGLYISRSLARAMAGDLEVESKPGEGSTFTLRIPSRAPS